MVELLSIAPRLPNLERRRQFIPHKVSHLARNRIPGGRGQQCSNSLLCVPQVVPRGKSVFRSKGNTRLSGSRMQLGTIGGNEK